MLNMLQNVAGNVCEAVGEDMLEDIGTDIFEGVDIGGSVSLYLGEDLGVDV